MFFKEPLTEWFFVEPKMVLLWHRCEEPFKHLYFQECCLSKLLSILFICAMLILFKNCFNKFIILFSKVELN